MDGLSPKPESYCAASFSGVPSCSYYNLDPDGVVNVKIGDLFDECRVSDGCGYLSCGTEYVFRAFAHNDPNNSSQMKSDFSSTLNCTTLSCGAEEGCTLEQGYWKTHTDVWLNALTLGNILYKYLELQSIFNTPASGNGLITLAH